MTEEQIKAYLRNRGCSKEICDGGKGVLLRKWESFVQEVEKGYCPNCVIQEYWSDLDTRDLIPDIGCDEEVTELDKRFAGMLTDTHIKHWRTDRNSDYDFWNRGYPKNAAGLFFEDIKTYILGQL